LHLARRRVVRALQLFPIIFLCAGCAATWTGASITPITRLAPSDEREWLSWPTDPTPAPPLPQPSTGQARGATARTGTPTGNRLVARARTLVGLSTLSSVAPHLPDDCTGLVRAVYEEAGIELMGSGLRGDNGVSAMFRLASEKRAIHTSPPQPGDLVFFRETYDRNRDGKLNDGLTHVGVVESVGPDGTVSFVHRIHGGVKRGKLHAGAPLDRKRNDYLRPAKTHAPLASTGELFVSYASASRLAVKPAPAAASKTAALLGRTPPSSRPAPLGTR
jgi:hypothetical protein